MPATGDGGGWRYFAAAAHGLDRTDGAGDAPGTGVTDSGGPGGPAAPEPTGTGGEPGPPVDGASYGVVVMHVSDDDGRTERADLLYTNRYRDLTRYVCVLFACGTLFLLVLLGALVGLIAVVQAYGLTSPLVIGSLVAAAASTVSAIAYGFGRLLARCADAVRSPLSGGAPASPSDPGPDVPGRS
ncbi:hypothetical protein ACIBL6_00295 [Streptomyces sp. NPDC050400]|uniref:hypothetical protein n=1 Tax=Streptomyces sp. NPDC050400 TaxID=3365610 RepID=UPI00379B8C28